MIYETGTVARKLQRFDQPWFFASNTERVNAPNLVKTFVLRLKH